MKRFFRPTDQVDKKKDDSQSPTDVVSFLRPILISSKILGIFPVKNIIFRKDGWKIESSLASAEGAWSCFMVLLLLSLGYSWLQRLDYSALVDVNRKLKLIDYIAVYVTTGAMHGMNIACCLWSVILSPKWVRLLQDFHKINPLLAQCKQKSRAVKIPYIAFYLLSSGTFIAICIFLLRTDIQNADLHILHTIGSIMTIDVFVRMALLCSLLRVLYRTYETNVREFISTNLEIAVDNTETRPHSWTSSAVEWASRLESFRRIHGHLNGLVEKSSAAFGWLLFTQFAGCFITILFVTYAFIANIVDSEVEKVAFIGAYLVFMVFKLISICVVVEGVTTKANSSLADLEKLSLNPLNRECRREIKMMIGKMSCKPPDITAANFFVINRKLLTSAAGALTTYLVILIQFNMSE